MGSRREPASQPPADPADPRLSLEFLLNPDAATYNEARVPMVDSVPDGPARRPLAQPQHLAAHAPLTTAEHTAERSRVMEQGIPQMGEMPLLPLLPPPQQGVPQPQLFPTPLAEHVTPAAPPAALPWLILPRLPHRSPLPSPARPTPGATTTPAAALSPARTLAPAETEAPAAQGLVVAANESTRAAAAAAVETPLWRTQHPTAGTLLGRAYPAEIATPGPRLPTAAGAQAPPRPIYPYDHHTYGPGVAATSPHHTERLAVTPTGHMLGHAPPPVSTAAGLIEVRAAAGDDYMQGITQGSAGSGSGGDAGGGLGGGGSSSGSGGFVNAVGAAGPNIGGRGGRRGIGGGDERRRRSSGRRPRVPCPRDGCTATFAQKAGK